MVIARDPLTGTQIGPKWVQIRSFHIFVGLTLWKGAVTSTYDRAFKTYTIFEGTSEIQRLIIARAISGMKIR